jgi:hypothetical protein
MVAGDAIGVYQIHLPNERQSSESAEGINTIFERFDLIKRTLLYAWFSYTSTQSCHLPADAFTKMIRDFFIVEMQSDYIKKGTFRLEGSFFMSVTTITFCIAP